MPRWRFLHSGLMPVNTDFRDVRRVTAVDELARLITATPEPGTAARMASHLEWWDYWRSAVSRGEAPRSNHTGWAQGDPTMGHDAYDHARDVWVAVARTGWRVADGPPGPEYGPLAQVWEQVSGPVLNKAARHWQVRHGEVTAERIVDVMLAEVDFLSDHTPEVGEPYSPGLLIGNRPDDAEARQLWDEARRASHEAFGSDRSNLRTPAENNLISSAREPD